MKIAEESIDTLKSQQETLEGAENTLRENDSMLSRSLQLLRGMTWNGAMQNLFERVAQFPPPSPENKDEDHVEGERNLAYNLVTLSPQAQKAVDPSETPSSSLHHLGKSIKQLHDYGRVISKQLFDSTNSLDAVTLHQDIALQKTFEVTSKASTLSTTLYNSPMTPSPQLLLVVVGDFEFYGIIFL